MRGVGGSRGLVLTRSIDNHSGGGEDGNLPTLCHPPIETGGGEVLGQGYLDNPPNENGEEFSGDTCYLGHCHTTPHPELEWLWKNPGRAIWLRKNPGRAILAAEKPWAGYFGRGKTLGGLFWLRKILGGLLGCGKSLGGVYWLRKNYAHAHILEI